MEVLLSSKTFTVLSSSLDAVMVFFFPFCHNNKSWFCFAWEILACLLCYFSKSSVGTAHLSFELIKCWTWGSKIGIFLAVAFHFFLFLKGYGFFSRIEERDMVQKIVEKSLICKSYITDIVSCTSVSCEKDLSRVSESLLIALKVVLSSHYNLGNWFVLLLLNLLSLLPKGIMSHYSL